MLMINGLACLLIITSLCVIMVRTAKKAALFYSLQSLVLVLLFVYLANEMQAHELYMWSISALVGTKMHEDPEMPNYGKRGRGKKFVEGMVVAIEPMINMGTKNINQLRDGWTILTRDGKPSAHFEHDVALIDGKPRLLSTFKYIYEALGIESHEEDEFLYK